MKDAAGRKPLPFGLDRTSSGSLKGQLAEGLREAIRTGYYRSGDILPSLSGAAASLGVSDIVTRAAYRRLAAEGLVVSRPRIGSIVLPPKMPIWRGHVLCVMTDFEFNIVQAGLVGALRERLVGNGFLFSQVMVLYGKGGKIDTAGLAAAFKRQVDFVVVANATRDVEEWLSRTRTPFLVVGGGRGESLPGCVARMGRSAHRAFVDLARKCAQRGLSRVEIVRFRQACGCGTSIVGQYISDAGVPVTERFLKVEWGLRRVESAERAGFDFVAKNLSRRSFRFPDLYYATDDHLARGMLAAFMAFGVDVPGTVRFACSSMAGFRPLYVRPVTCIEYDAYAVGYDVASQVLAWLGERKPFQRDLPGGRFVEGDTFP